MIEMGIGVIEMDREVMKLGLERGEMGFFYCKPHLEQVETYSNLI